MQEAGKIVKRPFAVGSKSEREAVFLDTGSHQYLLRRRGGNPFFDPELEKLVGKKVVAEGNVLGDYTFLVHAFEIVSSS